MKPLRSARFGTALSSSKTLKPEPSALPGPRSGRLNQKRHDEEEGGRDRERESRLDIEKGGGERGGARSREGERGRDRGREREREMGEERER